MKKNIRFFIVTPFHFPLFITSFYFLSINICFSNPQPLLISPFTNNPPTIDGRFSSGEWDDAAWESATTYNDTLGPERGRIYIKHNLTDLYLLVDYHTATGGNTEDVSGDLWLDLDNSGNNDGGFFTRIRFGNPITNWDFPATYAFADTGSPNNPADHWIIEYEIPLLGLGIQPGDLVGAHFYLGDFLGTGGEWYNSSNLNDLSRPAYWADLLLMRGDSLDPLPPTNPSAYSDYLTPTSILLTWDDPTHYQGGDTLTTLAWIRVYDNSNDSLLDSVAANVESLAHKGLTDGVKYYYYLVAVDSSDSTSIRTRSFSWYAGGHPFPSPPESLTAYSDSSLPNSAFLTWRDPTTQMDGTFLDDLAGIYIYHSGPDTLLKTVAAGAESTTVGGLPNWTNVTFYITASDNEVPSHESGPSDTATASIGGVAMEIFYDDSTRGFTYSPGSGPANYIGVRFSIPPTLPTPFDIVRVRIWLDSTSPLDEIQVCPSAPSGVPEYLNPYEVARDVTAPSPNTWALVDFPDPSWIDTREDLWVLARWENFTSTPLVGVDNSPPIDYRSFVSNGPPTWNLYTGGDMMVRLTLGSYGSVGTEEISDLRFPPESSSGSDLRLLQNYPNPFHSSTLIRYEIPPLGKGDKGGFPVRLAIYDITGRLVETLIDELQEPGVYQLPISNEQLPSSGVYFYCLQISQPPFDKGGKGDFTSTKKLILLR